MLGGAVLCMALNIYNEARYEPMTGQVAVALVTLNRSNHYQRGVCEEVYRHKQFSWTNDRFLTKTERVNGKLVEVPTNKLDPDWVHQYLEPKDDKYWHNAVFIAQNVLAGKATNFIGSDTMFYHADYVKPKWRHEMVQITKIGHHIFYRHKTVSEEDDDA